MVLVIDNYDSFTYNLVQYLGQAGAEVMVKRNDEITWPEIQALSAQGVLLSPGPCTPNEAGICLEVAARALKGELAVPLFGVCLGMQTIGQVAGGTIRRAKEIRHGKPSLIEHDGKGVFAGVPNPFTAIRYHSLVVDDASFPDGLEVSAKSGDDHEIMGLRHKTLAIEGVQFHPESILSESGLLIMENFVRSLPRAD